MATIHVLNTGVSEFMVSCQRFASDSIKEDYKFILNIYIYIYLFDFGNDSRRLGVDIQVKTTQSLTCDTHDYKYNMRNSNARPGTSKP